MSNPVVKRNPNETNFNNKTLVPANQHHNPTSQYQPNPPNSTLRPANPITQDIGYVDVTHRNKVRNLHIAYLIVIIITSAASFLASRVFFKPQASKVVAMADSALNDKKYKFQYNEKPQINEFDQKELVNQIYEKYDKARGVIRNNFDKEVKDKHYSWPSGENFYTTETYFSMRREVESAKLQLDGQQAIEMCERAQYMCRQANDFKNSKRNTASTE